MRNNTWIVSYKRGDNLYHIRVKVKKPTVFRDQQSLNMFASQWLGVNPKDIRVY